MRAIDPVGKLENHEKTLWAVKHLWVQRCYKEGCNFSIIGEYMTKKISETNAKKLLEERKTGLIKKLKGKLEK